MRTASHPSFKFATVRTYGRAPILAGDTSKRLLLNQFMETRNRFNLDVAGYVILDDHAHFLFGLATELDPIAPLNDLRAGFIRSWRQKSGNETPLWERGNEVRPAQTQDDLRGFLDFIHYDPVRHGLAERPADYPWSSLPARISQGHYSNYWGVIEPPTSLAKVVRGCAMA